MNASRLLITTPVALGDKNCCLWPAQSTRQQRRRQHSAESWVATKARINQHRCCCCRRPRPPACPGPSPFPPASLLRSRLEIAFLLGIENCKDWKKIDSVLCTNMMAVTRRRSGNDNISTTTTTTDRERKREREREETTKHDRRDDGRRESVILGSTSCPRKYVFIFNICPYYPSFCPFLFSQVEPSQSSKVFFYSLPCSANNPMFKKNS